jgi:DNA modification methylase
VGVIYLDDGDVVLHQGDVLEQLAGLPDASVDCCVTSPPYFGLRDYGVEGQIGLEDTPDAYITRLVGVFREVRRVLAPHGTCFVNMGDSYAGSWGNQGRKPERGTQRPINGGMLTPVHDGRYPSNGSNTGAVPPGVKPKDLLLMPARLALALQADGWWLRSDIIWAKPNPMPESVRDRPTSAHEHVFLLTKQPRYWWDAEAVREPHDPDSPFWRTHPNGQRAISRTDRLDGSNDAAPNTWLRELSPSAGRNVRNVWTIATEPTPDAHFATFPRELVRRCLAAGCPERVCRTCGVPSERIVDGDWYFADPPHPVTRRALEGAVAKGATPALAAHFRHLGAVNGTAGDGYNLSAGRHGDTNESSFVDRFGKLAVSAMLGALKRRSTGWSDCGHDAWRPGVCLDPFIGAGTTAQVARAMGRHAVGIDLNPAYLAIAARRLQQLSLLGGAA